MSSEIVVPIVTAVFGFAGGVVTTLLGPWAKWRVEKTRLQRQRRVERIAEWREGVHSLRLAEDEDTQTPLSRVAVVYPDGTDERDLSDLSRFGWFAVLKPLLSDEANKSVDELREEIVHYRKGQIPNLLDAEITRIEREKWNLV